MLLCPAPPSLALKCGIIKSMKLRQIFVLLLLTTPIFAAAQTAQSLIGQVGNFFNRTIIPLIFGIALLFFLWNIVRYFIIGGANEADRERARKLALWSILAFVLMVSVWGIVNLLVTGLEFGGNNGICPDYLKGVCK